MIDIIELAKECGVYVEVALPCSPNRYPFTTEQLTAFANAIVDMCADEIKHKVYAQDAECAIRALKVKG